MLPTSNIRGFFEILMPGVFLVLNAAITIIVLGSLLISQQMVSNTILESVLGNPTVVVAVLIVLGYPVGMALRLLKTTSIDETSAHYIAFLKPKSRNKLYLTDQFFYGNWMREKVHSHLPAEAARFYDEYWLDKYTNDGVQNTSFFNFCKIVIAKVDEQSGNEIYAAEAILRFLAGSYYALRFSLVLMVLDLVIAVIFHNPMAGGLIAAIILAYLFLLHVILSQFRFLRAKEVDTVFNASFANREEFEKLFPTPAGRRLLSSSRSPEVAIRRDLILNARQERWEASSLVQSLDLEKLISLMRKESGQHPYLSSLYFAGANVDHPFFLENSHLALGLAVLPEDLNKASTRKQHPHQTEFIIVLDGSICIHYDQDSLQIDQEITEGNYFVIPPKTWHWITTGTLGQAAYVFLKTNPSV